VIAGLGRVSAPHGENRERSGMLELDPHDGPLPACDAPAPPAGAAATRAMIGLVLTASAPRVGVEPFFIELVSGMEEVLAPAGATVLLLAVHDLEDELATYARWAAQGTVDAVVVVNLVHDDVRPARLARLGLPAVLAGRYAGPAALSSVVSDNAATISAALRLLRDLGHRRIGRVSGPAELVHTAERSTTMLACGQRLGLAVRIAEADYSAEAGARAARQLLAEPDPPTAIVFDNDVMAVAAEEELRGGVGVPAQVSLRACDDSTLCELAVPPLSALDVDVHEHGMTVGRAVLDVLRGARRRVYPGPPIRIRRRGSTGPAPAVPS
jgi:DNA-binding LacI/PurR family transcriptional regulator